MKEVKHGATNVFVVMDAVDSNGAALTSLTTPDFWYWRPGAAVVAGGGSVAEAAGVGDAHVDWEYKMLGDGRLWVAFPDAAFAAGVDQVAFGGSDGAGEIIGTEVKLVPLDWSVFYEWFFKRNTEHTELEVFQMRLTSGGAATGITPTVQREIDNTGFADVAAGTTVVELGNGLFGFSAIAAADLNGATITFRISEATCDDTVIVVKTLP